MKVLVILLILMACVSNAEAKPFRINCPPGTEPICVPISDPTPTPVSTATPIPTSTSTPIPTSTSTPVPPTATPTATNSSTPTPIQDLGGVVLPSDLIRLGAARLASGGDWNYGGMFASYFPLGDPTGSADGFPGSMYITGHDARCVMTEVGLPVPSQTSDLQQLPIAPQLQPFADPTAGNKEGCSLTTIAPKDCEVMEDHLRCVMSEMYMPQIGDPTFYDIDLQIGQNFQGTWKTAYPSAATSWYLSRIDLTWAMNYVNGMLLLSGRERHVNGGCWGTCLFAVDHVSNPVSGSTLESIPLLRYATEARAIAAMTYNRADSYDDVAWIHTSDGRRAVVIGTTKALSPWYYGPPDDPAIDTAPNDPGCGGKGYHGEPYEGQLLFFDPADLAEVASGTKQSSEPEPYARMVVPNLFGAGCRRSIIGGLGFDAETQMLYVVERMIVVPPYGRWAVIHYFEVN